MLFGNISGTTARRLAALFMASSLFLAAAVALSWVYIDQLLKTISQPPAVRMPSVTVSPLQVRYQLDVLGRGEIFPALSAGAAPDYWPVAVLTIANTSDRPLLEAISAEIPQWSGVTTSTVAVGPRETQTIPINPTLLPVAYENTEIRLAALEVRASSPGNETGYVQNRPVYLHPVSDFYWGGKFASAQFIARWVTPHNSQVIQLVSTARKYARRVRLAGYELPGNSSTGISYQVRDEARAVFETMQHLNISYVDSAYTFGSFASAAERVRLPRETLFLSSANCIDVSVAFASAMENLGMDSVIVIVPGHAFTGVRLARSSRQILYLDLTVLPDGTFERAMARAQYWLKKTPSNRVMMIDVSAARAVEIYPLPEPVGQKLPTSTGEPQRK